MEGSGHLPKAKRKPRKSWVSIIGVSASIRSGHLPNTIQKRCNYIPICYNEKLTHSECRTKEFERHAQFETKQNKAETKTILTLLRIWAGDLPNTQFISWVFVYVRSRVQNIYSFCVIVILHGISMDLFIKYTYIIQTIRCYRNSILFRDFTHQNSVACE
jgi:hypothetical protein